MATRRVEIGATGEAVRVNVASVRKQRGLTLRDVSDRLAQIGHPMAHNTVSEIERGARRVDVDDLTALAVALGVSPISLLLPGMPGAEDPDVKVQVTGVEHRVYLGDLWHWLQANIIKGAPPSWASVSRPLFEANGIPAWEHAQWMKVTDGDD
jgi:transcriptional regulator with XRE-family HTH domain